MAVLKIRDLPDKTRARLRVRAAKASHSMEAEAREILTRACLTEEPRLPPLSLQDLVDRLYGAEKPKDAVEDLIEERRREAREA